MIVVDVNVLAALLLPTPKTSAVEAVHELDPDWAAPPLWRSELRSILARQVRTDRLRPEGAHAALDLALELIVAEQDVEPARVLQLALESGCSAYDCDYVALAQALEVPLVTLDRQVLRRFPEVGCTPDRFAAATD